MSVLMIQVVDRSTGILVEQQLNEVQKRIGTIAAIVSDQGSDLVLGAKLFSENPQEACVEPSEPPLFDVEQITSPERAKPLVLKDFSHASSHILKAHLEADPKWKAFLSQCGSTQPKVKQTLLGSLAPPTQKVKGRYMNIGEIIRWGQKMLCLLNGTAGELPAKIDRATLKLKYGWLETYRESLRQWSEFDQLRETSLHVIRVSGYSSKSVDALQAKQVGLRNYDCSLRMAAELVDLARSQSQSIPTGVSYPGSSEVIESLIGKSKEVQGQHSRSGFTKMLLAIGASVVELTESLVEKSLESVREADVRTWTKEMVGDTLDSIRRRALPGTKGA
jgi:hypothetical protein